MRIKMILSYDGSHYAGWQRQENAVGIETIVMQAMERIHHHPVMIYASGRTDAGVHAFGQVIHFDTEITMDEEHWVRAMNALLPCDIRIQLKEQQMIFTLDLTPYASDMITGSVMTTRIRFWPAIALCTEEDSM